MWLRTVALRGLTWIFLIKCASISAQNCDNGKVNLETDLPPPDEFLCVEPGRRPSQKLQHISTIYPQQPAEHICMDNPIRYNHTIPNSGPHRPVGAESGEYLYCPPQRWLNNLKDGATVLLYHPCVSKASQKSLGEVARSCLSHYVLTAHPQLQQDRPFALVLWGRTLEVSHITAAGVCEWLVAANSKLKQIKKSSRPKYSLFLTKTAPADQKWGTDATKSLGKNRSALASEVALQNVIENAKTEGCPVHILDGRYPEGFSSYLDLRVCCMEVLSASEEAAVRKSRAALQPPVSELIKEFKVQVWGNITQKNSEKLKSSQLLNVTEDKASDAADLHVTPLVEAVETGERTHTAKNGVAVQEKAALDSKEHLKSPKKGIENRRKHRVKTEAGEQSEKSENPDEAMPERFGGAAQGPRMRTHRTDEAVWAAAALGFLLVLLTLSVLHTRLYRNWRTPASLYWHETRQDYESVGDIIRRRLKMVGRRKRRASQSRRQECSLLPNSSTDNESD